MTANVSKRCPGCQQTSQHAAGLSFGLFWQLGCCHWQQLKVDKVVLCVLTGQSCRASRQEKD